MAYRKKQNQSTSQLTTIKHVVQKPLWDLEQALGVYAHQINLPYKSLPQLFTLELAASLLELPMETVRNKHPTLELPGRKVYIHPELIAPDIQKKFINALEETIQVLPES